MSPATQEQIPQADEYASPQHAGDHRVIVLCRVLGGDVHTTDEKKPCKLMLEAILAGGGGLAVAESGGTTVGQLRTCDWPAPYNSFRYSMGPCQMPV